MFYAALSEAIFGVRAVTGILICRASGYRHRSSLLDSHPAYAKLLLMCIKKDDINSLQESCLKALVRASLLTAAE